MVPSSTCGSTAFSAGTSAGIGSDSGVVVTATVVAAMVVGAWVVVAATVVAGALDEGAVATELVQRLAAASAFSEVRAVHDGDMLRQTIDAQAALLAIRIPPDW